MEDLTGNWVVAGNLVCAPGQAPAPSLEDMKAALLFAQLTADAKYPGQRSSTQWFAEHDKAMIASKWIGLEFERHSFEPGAADSVTIMSIIERFLLAGLAPAHAEAMRQAVACLAGQPEGQAQGMFNSFALVGAAQEHSRHASETETSVALMVTVLKPDAVAECLWIAFITTAHLTEDFLQQSVVGAQLKSAVEARLFQREWNAAGYATVRSKVEKYLGNRPATLIVPLACAGHPEQDPATTLNLT